MMMKQNRMKNDDENEIENDEKNDDDDDEMSLIPIQINQSIIKIIRIIIIKSNKLSQFRLREREKERNPDSFHLID